MRLEYDRNSLLHMYDRLLVISRNLNQIYDETQQVFNELSEDEEISKNKELRQLFANCIEELDNHILALSRIECIGAESIASYDAMVNAFTDILSNLCKK